MHRKGVLTEPSAAKQLLKAITMMRVMNLEAWRYCESRLEFKDLTQGMTEYEQLTCTRERCSTGQDPHMKFLHRISCPVPSLAWRRFLLSHESIGNKLPPQFEAKSASVSFRRWVGKLDLRLLETITYVKLELGCWYKIRMESKSKLARVTVALLSS